ncbi:MAG: hypothetical protein IJQ83_07270 [Bacteroidales bacterium]|nr:hypothetical protein [Bacteroidales bacterium]
MATTKKTKVVDWNKELSKATGKYVRAIDKLFKDFEKEVSEFSRPMHLNQRNDLWKTKYQPKLDKLEAKEDAAYKRLWEKYFDPKTRKPKPGITFKK